MGDAVGGGRRLQCVCAEGNILWGLENPMNAKNRQLTQQLALRNSSYDLEMVFKSCGST